MGREPARETVQSLSIYRGDERLGKGGERVWPGIIQLPLQADILREAQLNKPLYEVGCSGSKRYHNYTLC